MRILLLILALLAAWPAQAQPRVLASIEPLAMLARELLGEQAQVETLLLPSQNPHFAAFTPGQLRKLEQADLIVWLGADAEPHVAAMINRVQTAQLAMLSLDGLHRISATEHGHHDHGDVGDIGLDRHLWLSPDNMALLATALAARLSADVAQPEVLAARLTALRERLAGVGRELRDQLADVRGRPYLSHHDPWAYFAEYAGLARARVISDSLEGSASARRFAELAARMQDEAIQCVLMEPEARQALLRRLCQGECRLVTLDPLGRDWAGGDYSAFLMHLGNSFRQCLAGPDSR